MTLTRAHRPWHAALDGLPCTPFESVPAAHGVHELLPAVLYVLIGQAGQRQNQQRRRTQNQFGSENPRV